MAEINISKDCGNSPKQQFIKDLNIAFVEEDIKHILSKVSEDIIFEHVGQQKIKGKAAFQKMVRSMEDTKITHLSLESVITHGTLASANGIMVMNNGDCYEFCDVYHFSNARGKQIKSIKAFVVPCAG